MSNLLARLLGRQSAAERERLRLETEVEFWRSRTLAAEQQLRDVAHTNAREIIEARAEGARHAEGLYERLVQQSREYVEGASRLMAAPSPYLVDTPPPVAGDDDDEPGDWEGAALRDRAAREAARLRFAAITGRNLTEIEEACRSGRLSTSIILQTLADLDAKPVAKPS